jgi:putative sigma-54 modulation protein
MALPHQLTFRGLQHSDPMARYVRKRAAKLATFYERITSCRVAIEASHRHGLERGSYRVRVDLVIPGHQIVVSRELEEPFGAIEEAFEGVQRRLQEYARLVRGEARHHQRARSPFESVMPASEA